MKRFLLVFVVIIAAGLSLPAFAQKPPSPDHPVGWRGDGTGRYPDADPPLNWGRVARSVKNLSARARSSKAAGCTTAANTRSTASGRSTRETPARSHRAGVSAGIDRVA